MLPPPTPVIKDEIEGIQFSNTKTYKLENKNEIYQLKISFNETLIFFEIEKLNLIPKKDFNIHLSLKELGKINKFFNQFDEIAEVFISFDTLLGSKNISVFEEEEKKIQLKIHNPANKKEFYLDIPFKEKDLKSEIKSIYEYINSLNNKIIDLEKKVDDLCTFKEEYLKRKKEKKKNGEKEEEIEKVIKDKKIIKLIEKLKEIDLVTKKEEKIEKEKEKEKEEEIENLDIFKDSNIIQKDEDIKLILSWLNKKSIKTNLLFDSKTDGNLLSDLYKKVKNKFPILVVIKSKKGYRFGGYSPIPIICDEKWYKEDNSFIFSLETKNKYNAKTLSNTHILGNENLFQFGNDIRIYNLFTRTNDNFVGKCDYDSPINYEINGGDRNYTVLNLEIYEIIFY